jgi:hypothetical protein
MTQHIRERIARKLDGLTEDRLYQVLDFVEFLESKYAARQNPPPNAFQKFAEGIEDKLRAGRVSAATISETMGFLNRAVGVLNGVAAAGKSVAADLANAAQRVGTAVADATTQAGTAIGGTTGTGTTTPTSLTTTDAPPSPTGPTAPPDGAAPPTASSDTPGESTS